MAIQISGRNTSAARLPRPPGGKHGARKRLWIPSFLTKTVLLGLATLAIVLGVVAYRRLERLRLDSAEVKSLRQVADNLRREQTEISNELATTLRALTDTAAERDAATSARDVSAKELRTVIERAVDETATVAANLTSDPWLCRSIISRATDFADRHQADSGRLAEISRSLPLPSTLPPGANVELVEVSRDEGIIVIDFVVQDSRGRPIMGLRRGDVEVLHGDRRLHALGISEVTRPTGQNNFAVLLDTSSSTSGVASQAMKRGASDLARLLANPSRIRLWRFADTVDAISPWTFDASIHEAAIQSLTPKGSTNLYRCIRVAAEDLVGRPGSRTIILFTDGTDSFRQDSVETVTAICRSAEIVVHVVALLTAETNESTLQQIAASTGGNYHVGSDPEQIIEQFRLLAERVSRPVYRLRLNEATDALDVTMRIADLKPVLVKTPH